MLYRIKRVRLIADLMYSVQNIAGLAYRRIPTYLQLLGSDVEIGGCQTRHLCEATLDQPNAGGTTNTLNRQHGLGAAVSTIELLRKFGKVIQLEGRWHSLNHALRHALSRTVVICQPAIDDSLRNSGATGTAHRLINIVNRH